MTQPIRIGTRKSPLAIWQAKHVESLLKAQNFDVEIVPIVTEGDTLTASVSAAGSVGLFTKEIQRALLDKRCDVAVHSLKDLPTETVHGLVLSAVPPREDPRDCLVTNSSTSLAMLKHGASIGTGSLRRAGQLRRMRTDLAVEDIRGNVDSRLKKLDSGAYDAIVLAIAGLKRLGLQSRATEIFEVDRMLPAIGQAALGLEARIDDGATNSALLVLNDRASYLPVLAERSLLRSLRGGCLAPIAAYATLHAASTICQLRIEAKVFSRDGQQMIEATGEEEISISQMEDTHVLSDLADLAEALGARVAEQLIAHGANDVIAQSRSLS